MPDERDLWQLIAAPVTAFNEAEAANGARFVELMTEYAFLPEPPGADCSQPGDDSTDGPRPLRFRELAFQVESRNELGQVERRDIRIPRIQYIPSGGLPLDQAQLKYALVLNHLSTEAGTSGSTARQLPAPLPRFVGKIARRVGSPTDPPGGETSDGNVEIEMELKQIDLPGGVLDLIHQTHGGITTVHPDPSPWEDDSQPPEPPGRIFGLRILGTSSPILTPGEGFSAWAELKLNQEVTQGRPVLFEVTPSPKGSLIIRTPRDGHFVTDEDRDLVFRLGVSKQVARYRPETPVGLNITARVEGLEECQHELIELPRFLDNP